MIHTYCSAFSSPPLPVLQELERATHLRTISPQMMSGAYQGLLLQFISRMMQPRRILEIGAFTGYASICLAQGLPNDGHLHTIEVDDELGPIFREFVDKAGLTHKITLHHGDAAAIVPSLGDEPFDLVFLDAGKLDYLKHYELLMPRLRPGGFLLIDNVLWDGKVPNPQSTDATAIYLRNFNAHVHADARVENLILPLRDGLMIVRKKS